MARSSAEPLRRVRRAGRGSRGQTLTEFILILVYLLLVFFSVFQVCLIAMQKLQFNRDAYYAARAWSVRQDEEDPADTLDTLKSHLKWVRWPARLLAGKAIPPVEEWRWRCMSAVKRGQWDEDSSSYTGLVALDYPDHTDYSGYYPGIVFKVHIPLTLPGIRSFINDPTSANHIEGGGHGKPNYSTGNPADVVWSTKTWRDMLGTTRTVTAATFVPMAKFPAQHPCDWYGCEEAHDVPVCKWVKVLKSRQVQPDLYCAWYGTGSDTPFIAEGSCPAGWARVWEDGDCVYYCYDYTQTCTVEHYPGGGEEIHDNDGPRD